MGPYAFVIRESSISAFQNCKWILRGPPGCDSRALRVKMRGGEKGSKWSFFGPPKVTKNSAKQPRGGEIRKSEKAKSCLSGSRKKWFFSVGTFSQYP